MCHSSPGLLWAVCDALATLKPRVFLFEESLLRWLEDHYTIVSPWGCMACPAVPLKECWVSAAEGLLRWHLNAAKVEIAQPGVASLLPMAPAGRGLWTSLAPETHKGFMSEGKVDRTESLSMSYLQLSYRLKLSQVICALPKCWTKKKITEMWIWKTEESSKFKFKSLTIFSGIAPYFYIFSSVHKPLCVILPVLGFMIVPAYYKCCV